MQHVCRKAVMQLQDLTRIFSGGVCSAGRDLFSRQRRARSRPCRPRRRPRRRRRRGDRDRYAAFLPPPKTSPKPTPESTRISGAFHGRALRDAGFRSVAPGVNGETPLWGGRGWPGRARRRRSDYRRRRRQRATISSRKVSESRSSCRADANPAAEAPGDTREEIPGFLNP